MGPLDPVCAGDEAVHNQEADLELLDRACVRLSPLPVVTARCAPVTPRCRLKVAEPGGRQREEKENGGVEKH